jgi:hypothetical protein
MLEHKLVQMLPMLEQPLGMTLQTLEQMQAMQLYLYGNFIKE